MDPLANLTEQFELANKILVLWDPPDEAIPEEAAGLPPDAEEIAEHAARLAELVLALDEWRRKGGFDPYTATNP